MWDAKELCMFMGVTLCACVCVCVSVCVCVCVTVLTGGVWSYRLWDAEELCSAGSGSQPQWPGQYGNCSQQWQTSKKKKVKKEEKICCQCFLSQYEFYFCSVALGMLPAVWRPENRFQLSQMIAIHRWQWREAMHWCGKHRARRPPPCTTLFLCSDCNSCCLQQQLKFVRIIIIIAFKGAVRDFLQSPHSAANCLQYVRSSGPGAIVCKSRATHWALIMCKCHVTCHLVRRDSSAIKSDRVEIAFIWALFYWLNS